MLIKSMYVSPLIKYHGPSDYAGVHDVRWAMSTSGAIQAGVMWTIVAGIHGFIKDRWKINPDATVVFTGGDGRVSS